MPLLHRVFTAFSMCLAKYTRFPFPKKEWDDDLQPVSEFFLPAVGLVIGLIWWLLAGLSWWLLPGFLGAALAALYPIAVTGFENLREFTAVSASLLEKRKLAERDTCLQILPAALMLLQFSLCLSLDHIFALAMIPVLSRSCLVLMRMKPAKREEDGQDDEPQLPASLIRIEQGVALGALVLMLLFAGGSGLLCGAAVLASCWAILRFLGRGEDNVSPSLAGFALTASEFCGLLILAVL